MKPEKLSLFNFEHHVVRSVEIDGEPWFVVVDVCKALGILNASQAVARLSDKQKRIPNMYTIHIGPKQPWLVNEYGLYKLVFLSRKPEAIKFTDWVAEEVLPSLRKTGMYFGSTYDKAKDRTIARLQSSTQIYKESTKRIEGDLLAARHRVAVAEATAQTRLERMRSQELRRYNREFREYEAARKQDREEYKAALRYKKPAKGTYAAQRIMELRAKEKV